MITQEQYDLIKNYNVEEIINWIRENNLQYSDISDFMFSRNYNSETERCSCCGETVEDGCNKECVWYDS